MTFFNKKQEVVDVQLTRFGKNLLARGAFKPHSYQFFDDDIIYSADRIGVIEEQNESEPRIKEGIRLKSQHTVVPLETSFDEQQKLIEHGLRGAFLKMRRQMDPLEADKLLKYPLANSKQAEQTAPSFTLMAFGADISGSAKYNDPSVNGIYLGHRPEIEFKPVYTFEVDRRNVSDAEDVTVDSEHWVDLTKKEVEFLDKSTITRSEQNVIIDLVEHLTSYGLDNFEVEVYEEVGDGSDDDAKRWVRILDEEKIFNLVNITTDESVEEISSRQSKSRNFYSE